MSFDHWRHYARAWLFHFMGRDDRAFAEFSALFSLDPTNISAAQHLAGIAASRQQWEVAGDWYEKLLKLKPEDAEAWFNLGFVREHGLTPHAAIIAFNEAARLQPALDRAWYGMGRAYAQLGQHRSAATAFERAVALQPMNGEAFYQLGMAYHHAGEAQEVRRIVLQLVSFEPKRASALVRDAQRNDLAQLIPQLPF